MIYRIFRHVSFFQIKHIPCVAMSGTLQGAGTNVSQDGSQERKILFATPRKGFDPRLRRWGACACELGTQNESLSCVLSFSLFPRDSESRHYFWILPLSAGTLNWIGGQEWLSYTENKAKRENFKWLFKLLFFLFYIIFSNIICLN